MDLCFITPTSFLSRYSNQGDCFLALAHLIDDEGQNDYATFHRREADKGRRVILDNGLFEGAQVDTESLLRRAEVINASVVCAPDVLYDSSGTIKEFKAFIKAKQEVGLHCDVMGIPQADNPADWWDCFRFMDLSKECKLIGLSILSIPQSFEHLARGTERITHSRLYLLRELLSYQTFVDRPITPCHMLGLGESFADITFATRMLPDAIVSNDSSSAFVHGLAGVRYSRMGTWHGGKIAEKVDFNLKGPDARYDVYLAEDQNIQHNINVALSIAHTDWR